MDEEYTETVEVQSEAYHAAESLADEFDMDVGEVVTEAFFNGMERFKTEHSRMRVFGENDARTDV